MATPSLSDLGTQSTYKVYIGDSDSAKGSSNGIVANLDNTTDIRVTLLEHAAANRALVYETTNYGYSTKDISGSASYFKYYLADASGVEGTVTADALDITSYITNGFRNEVYPTAEDLTASPTSDEISGDKYTYLRKSATQVLKIDTEASGATDDLFEIVEENGNIADRDIIILTGTDIARVITLRDHTGAGSYGGTKNISLDSEVDFSTGDGATYEKAYITLMYDKTNTKWVEINRAPKAAVTDTTLRGAGINFPIKGAEVISTVTGGATISLVPGTDKGVQYVTGTHALGSSNWTLAIPTGGTPKEGDEFVCEYHADITTTGTVSILGATLSSAEASSGSTRPTIVTIRYMNAAWQTANKSVDGADVEPLIANPSTTGQYLTSTTAGVRSWETPTLGLRFGKFTYDFSVHGGSIGTLDIALAGSNALLPDNIIIDTSQSYVEIITPLTSGGSATVELGLSAPATTGASITSDVDFFLTSRAYSATAYDTAHRMTKGESNFGKATGGTSYVTFTISAAALTAGKFNVYVAYYQV